MQHVSTTTLFRLSGLALLVALPIQIVGFLLHPAGERVVDLLSPMQGPAHLVLFVSWFCVLLGLPGLYVWQAERAGRLGLLGFVASMFSLAYVIYLVVYEAFPAVLLAQDPTTAPLIATGGPLAHGAGAFGGDLSGATILAYPLFGLATLRAGVLPRLVGWLQILCVPLGFIPIMLIPDSLLPSLPAPVQPIAILYYLLFVAYARGGYALWSGERAHAVSAARTPMQQVAAS
jgi:hypothetical protein